MSNKRRAKIKIAMGDEPQGWQRSHAKMAWENGDELIKDEEINEWKENHTCDICGDGPDRDIRSLKVDCFYNLKEVSNKFRDEGDYYMLKFCKPCRGHFMFSVLSEWIDSDGHKEDPHRNGESPIQFVN